MLSCCSAVEYARARLLPKMFSKCWFYLESDYTNPLQRPSEGERQSERARFKDSFKMFGSRHDSFVYCQDWRQTVTSLTRTLSVEESSRGDGEWGRNERGRDKGALSDKIEKSGKSVYQSNNEVSAQVQQSGTPLGVSFIMQP